MISPAQRLRTASFVLGALVCVAAASPRLSAESPAGTDPSDTIAMVLELTNAARTEAGLRPLRESRRLMYAAQLQSDQMETASRMDHVLRGTRYPNPADRLAAANYPWEAFGENVAVGQRSAADVVNAWMKSPGHRANILNPRYTELGIGYAVDDAGRPYYAQVFGRPRS